MRTKTLSGLLTMIFVCAIFTTATTATTYQSGLKVGDKASYSMAVPSIHIDMFNVTITALQGSTNMTVNLNQHNSTSGAWELVTYSHNCSSGDAAPIGWYTEVGIAVGKNLNQYDPLWIGLNWKINGTLIQTLCGEDRELIWYQHTGADYNLTLRYDRATGILVYYSAESIGIVGTITLTGTNIWPAPADLTVPLLIAGIGAVVVVVGVGLYLRGRRK